MKKRMLVLLTAMLLVSSVFGSIAVIPQRNFQEVIDNVKIHITSTLNRFKDISSSEWYLSKVAKLVGLGGINGYTDGTFKPNNLITQGEFIKIVVAVFEGEQQPASKNEHWAMNYVRQAEKLEYIDAGEYKASELDKAISRYQMSKIVAKVATARGEDFLPNRADYIYQINDYGYVPETYRCPVLKAFTQGLISGYPDGQFKGSQGLTRAEASTVIVRLFDESERVKPKEPVATSEIKKIEEVISNPSAIHDVFKVTTAIIYSSNPYETDTYTAHGTTFFKVKGLNNLYIVKDNKIIKIMNSYPNSDGFRYHTVPVDIELSEIEYFGAVEYYNDTMFIFPNPYK